MTDTPNPVDQHVGVRIRARRNQLGVSRETLSKPMGITWQQFAKYETATNRVSASKLWAIAQALNVPVGWFFVGLPDQSTAASPELPALLALAGTRQGSNMAEAFLKLSPAQQGVVVSLARQLGGAVDEEPET